MGHRHWGLDLLEAAVPSDDFSSAPCRTVAPEKCYEYELAESAGREIWGKEQIQEQVVGRTLEGSSRRVLSIKKGPGPSPAPVCRFSMCRDGNPCVGLEEQLGKTDALSG